MAHVLQLDCTSGNGDVEVDFGSTVPEVWVEFDIAFNSTFLSTVSGQKNIWLGQGVNGFVDEVGGIVKWKCGSAGSFTPSALLVALQFYHLKIHLDGTGASGPLTEMWVDGTLVGTDTTNSYTGTEFFDLAEGLTSSGALVYYDNFKAGTTEGGTELGTDDFESGSLAFWNSFVSDATIISDPGITPSAGSGGAVEGRVLIAFDDGPLVAVPTWTRIDGATNGFPDQFVSGYDIETGRQTLISQTDTGTATVYINDHDLGLFDPRNVSSPYFGKLDGRQILLQLYDPVAAAWEDQFRGFIDDITWDIDGSAVNASGEPINASIQIECVDMFDYLAGYGLTPGLDGVTPQSVPSGGTLGGTPPAGFEDGVYYAATAGSVDDRFIEVLTDVGIDSSRYTVASGNVHVKAVKYDPDESALQALRDAADAELPFIANIYCDRHGNFQFRGRYSRFDPDAVSAEVGSTWDFTRWAVGDGPAIQSDPTRAQMRLLSFARNRSDIINVAIAYPQGMAPSNMPGQVFADTTSITAYGKHAAPPMSDLLTDTSDVGGRTDLQETALYAELLVKNQKDPRENISALQVKTVAPDDTRAATTWALLTKADISHIINVKVGYPAGTGLAGASPDDDYYIEGRRLRVRPLQPGYDYVECDYDLSPAVWSMDTHSVFPPFS